MTNRLAVLVALVATVAFAQVVQYGVQTSGSKLPTRPILNFTGPLIGCADDKDGGRTNCTLDAGAIPTQTTGALTLYVNLDGGNDSSPCTGGDGGVCLTFAAAIAKLPINLNDNATINVADATYAEPLNIVRPFNIAYGVTLLVAGTMTNATLSSGNVTGTVTSSANGSSTAGPASITDAAQTWTVNDLKGKFITFTSGTYNGQSYPITSNTATSLTFPIITTAAVGVTYTIQTPGAVFSSPLANPSAIYGQIGQGTVQVSNVKITRPSNTPLAVGSIGNAASSSYVLLISVHVEAVTANGINNISGRLDVRRSYIKTAGTGFGFNNTFGVSPGSAGSINNSYVVSTSGPAYVTPTGGSGPSISVFEGGSSTTPIVAFANPATGSIQASTLWVTCTGGAGSVGVGAYAPTSTSMPAGIFTSNFNSRITGCTVGFQVSGRMAATVNGAGFSSVTTAFSAVRGGQLIVLGTPSFTSVTNELSIDGTSYTFAYLNGLPAPQVISNSYGSYLSR